MKNLRVLAVGAVVADYIFVTDLAPKRDEKKRADEMISSIGGPSFTALAFLKTQGIDAHFVGNVGDDAAGREIARYCQERQIGVANNFVLANQTTTTASIWVEREHGSRTVLWAQSEGLEWSKTDVRDLSQFSLLLCDGHNIGNAIALARECRELGIPVLLDAGSAKDREEELLAHTTYLIASSRYLTQRFPGQSPKRASLILLENYPELELAGFTLGAKGFVGRSRLSEYCIAGREVGDVRDSTGAGDVFHGAFAHALLKKGEIEEALMYANYCAAQSCQYYGSVNAVEAMHSAELLQPKVLELDSCPTADSMPLSAVGL